MKYTKSPPKIEIRGKQIEWCSNKEIRYATNYFLSKLVSPQLKSNLHIVYHLKPRHKMAPGMFGFTIPLDDSYKPRKFSVWLNADGTWMTREILLKTIAHELVHVKQIAKREFDPVLRKGNYMRWNKELIYCGDEDHERYLFYPWEIEARGLEEACFYSYCQHLNQVQRR